MSALDAKLHDIQAATELTLSRKGDATTPLLSLRGLQTRFPLGRKYPWTPPRVVHAVEDVHLDIRRGEILGLVGESGSGKTTLGRALLRLVEPTDGRIIFDGQDVTKANDNELRNLRRRMQIIFQDPYASLNPRMTVGETINEAYVIHKLHKTAERKARIGELLSKVGLTPSHATRFPHEFSGGQRQRIGIARALAVEPDFVVADEPVSALDVSIQAQVINLLSDLKDEFGLTMLFISHDLGVVEYLVDRIAVMYLGRLVEVGPASEVYSRPRHPYTQALLSAVPDPVPGRNRKRQILQGDIPSPILPPSGCVFRTRCPIAGSDCAAVVPPMEPVGPGHIKACIKQ
ncbi:ABC transporter ATP-binding protein [Yoonia sp.]|uniref:ABC transporter ATP-binding protein n=1 Tax=Yoonia sp. TaxID=2212373 RepID=UPI003A4D946D